MPTPAVAATAGCDRRCRKSLLNDYLAAVVKHDPAAAPRAPSYRHTENAINVPLGNGVWRSVTGFWIEDGKIRNIWSAMYYPGPERPVPNWPPYEGNFPLPVFATTPATSSAPPPAAR
jgi:hypothetical protein